MRIIYRDTDNKDYWENRWSQSGVDSSDFADLSIYPIKYAEMVVHDSTNILEAGCGSGMLYFHYKNMQKQIQGVDNSKTAVANILKADPQANVREGDICNLPYEDGSFDAVLAFGLFHNLPEVGLIEKAFEETARVMKSGGRLVASVRYDSLENRLIERIVRHRSGGKEYNSFHRVHFTLEEVREFLVKKNMVIEKFFYARNVSFLFKFDFFRSKDMKSDSFSEQTARSRGFTLNFMGRNIDRFLHRFFTKLFSNLLVVIARKN